MDNWVLNLPAAHWPGPVLFRFFVPGSECVVLSSSNRPEVETHFDAVRQMGIPVLRRKGGGGTVLLSPGCLVLTLAFYAKDLFSNPVYFRAINELWSQALSVAGVSGVETKGISDLAIGDKKIGGTSLFRRKHLLVYQGSLLVCPDEERMSQVLAHPSREPDYRLARNHEDFLTSTQKQGCLLSPQELASLCDSYFQKNAKTILASHILH